VLADYFRGLGEEDVGLGEAAEVRLLQRFIDQRLGAIERRVARAAAWRCEELGGLGVAAGVVPAISLFQRLVRSKRSRLHASECGGIADPGGGGGNIH